MKFEEEFIEGNGHCHSSTVLYAGLGNQITPGFPGTSCSVILKMIKKKRPPMQTPE